MNNLYESTTIDLNKPLLDYYRERILNQMQYVDSYKGVRILKFPEDLRTYERIIDENKPEVILELGVESGGSSIWFADRLDALCGGGDVIGVDINLEVARENLSSDKRITLIEGDLASDEVIDSVKNAVNGRRVMIIEDAAHSYECTYAALTNYSDLVHIGDWFIVEDGIVDIEALRHYAGTPRGVIGATDVFMQTEQGKKFNRFGLAPYGITSNPGGWLQREHQ